MRLHGALADVQLVRDLLVAVPAANQVHNLALPGGQAGEATVRWGGGSPRAAGGGGGKRLRRTQISPFWTVSTAFRMRAGSVPVWKYPRAPARRAAMPSSSSGVPVKRTIRVAGRRRGGG